MKQITIAGYIGGDAESRSAGENIVTTFSVAVKAWSKDNPDGTLWFRCAYWGVRGEKTKPYLLKGKPVSVAGDLGLDEYDKRDGSRGTALTVRVDSLTLLGGRDAAPGSAPTGRPTPAQTPQRESQADNGFSDDQIPF